MMVLTHCMLWIQLLRIRFFVIGILTRPSYILNMLAPMSITPFTSTRNWFLSKRQNVKCEIFYCLETVWNFQTCNFDFSIACCYHFHRRGICTAYVMAFYPKIELIFWCILVCLFQFFKHFFRNQTETRSCVYKTFEWYSCQINWTQVTWFTRQSSWFWFLTAYCRVSRRMCRQSTSPSLAVLLWLVVPSPSSTHPRVVSFL